MLNLKDMIKQHELFIDLDNNKHLTALTLLELATRIKNIIKKSGYDPAYIQVFGRVNDDRKYHYDAIYITINQPTKLSNRRSLRAIRLLKKALYIDHILLQDKFLGQVIWCKKGGYDEYYD